MNHHEDDMPLSEEEMEQAQRGEDLIAAAVSETQAPASLRESLERDRGRAQAASPVPFWRRHGRILAGAGVAAVAAIALVVALQPGPDEGAGRAPTLADIEASAQRPATEPAPDKAGGDPPVLEERVGMIQFPDWEKKFEWHEVGSRSDEAAGRTVKTVFYRNPDGAQLGYAIVDGAPIDETPPGREIVHEGKKYHVANYPQRTVVTWVQQGHTCTFVASSAVPDLNLVELAASRNV